MRCWFWHQFGRWTMKAEGPTQMNGREIGWFVRQVRTCAKCGWQQVRDQMV